MSEEELRRVDDRRFRELQSEIKSVAKDVSSIRDMLISEPEASPMGRALIQRSLDNRVLITQQRADFDKHVQAFEEYKREHEDDVDKLLENHDTKEDRWRKERFDPMYDWWQRIRGSWMGIASVGVILGIVSLFFALLANYGPQ